MLLKSLYAMLIFAKNVIPSSTVEGKKKKKAFGMSIQNLLFHMGHSSNNAIFNYCSWYASFG